VRYSLLTGHKCLVDDEPATRERQFRPRFNGHYRLGRAGLGFGLPMTGRYGAP